MALTDREVRAAKATQKAFKVWDGGGLHLLVTPTGGKLWRWSYRFEHKAKLMTLGKYPDVPLLEARKKHLAGRQLLATGVDPMVARKQQAPTRSQTFGAQAERWLLHWKKGVTERHGDMTQRRLEQNVLPFLGDLPLGAVTSLDIVHMLQRMNERGVTDLAKRSLETTSQIYRHAIAHGLAERNPAADIRPRDVLGIQKKKNYARVSAPELPELLRRIDIYHGRPATRLAMKIMALTFVRTTELIGARWEEFDFKELRWNIPAERMKMRSPHIVPLARQTMLLLGDLHLISGKGAFLFPHDIQARRHMCNASILRALIRMGYKGVHTGHGFRGLASTILHEQGVDSRYIEMQLAHTQRNAVAAAYNHATYLSQRTAMMQTWADYLDSARAAAILSTIQA